jgi:hypothetical protein
LNARAVTYATVSILLACLPNFFSISLSHRRKSDLPDSESGLRVLAANRSSQQPSAPGTDAQLPQLVDITDSTGIKFDHLSNPEHRPLGPTRNPPPSVHSLNATSTSTEQFPFALP